MTVIDTATDAVVASVKNVGPNPLGAAVTPDGTKVYVTNGYLSGGKTVSRIDTATNNVTDTINVGSSPIGVAATPDGKKVYVTNQASNTVSVIDTATDNVTSTIPVGNYPLSVAVNPAGTKAYVSNTFGYSISVIDTANDTVIDTIPGISGSPMEVAVSPDGTKVYVDNQYSNTVSVIDTATDNITATVNVGNFPQGLAISPDGTKVYVANRNDNTISVIDTATNNVTATVNVGNYPAGVGVTPDGTKIYVINYNSNTVSVIDAETNNVTATINVGSGPQGWELFMGLVPVPVGTNLYLSNQAPSSKNYGSSMTYTLYYNDFGNSPAHNVTLVDQLDDNVTFVSASDGGVYNSSTKTVSWDIGLVNSTDHGYRTLNISIPQDVPFGTVIANNANISTSEPEIKYDDNEAQAKTQVTGLDLPKNVDIEPNNGGAGTLSVNWHNSENFSYHTDKPATAVIMTIHFDNGAPDLIEDMSGGPYYWICGNTFYPNHGGAEVTYTVESLDITTNIISYTNITFPIYIDPAGYIYDVDTGQRIANATVWLQRPDGNGGWENVPTGETPPVSKPDTNPLISDQDGGYQWDVLEGSYRVHVEAPGYEPGNSTVVSVPPPVEDLDVGLHHINDPNAPQILPVANFSTNVNSGYAPLTIQFTDNSLNANGWSWDFGDGNTSNDRYPSHTYTTPRTYTVTLKAINGNGVNSTSSTITALEALVYPVAGFTEDVKSGVAPLTVNFTDYSQYATTVNWDFNGDGVVDKSVPPGNQTYTYTSPGTYVVNQTVINANGSANVTDTITVAKAITPVKANFTFSANNLAVQFTDTSTGSPNNWTWDYGDNNGSNAPSPSYTYTKAGTYNVKLTVKNADGSTDSITKGVTVTATPVPLVANFTENTSSGTAPLTVQFTDQSTGNIASRSWDFNDTYKSADVSPLHTFINAGSYNVVLTVTDTLGLTAKKNVTISVTAPAPPQPTALKINDFKADITNGYEPLKVNFTSDVSGSPTQWTWKFERLGTQSFKVGTATHTFMEDGIYDVTLTVKDAKGLTDSMTKKAYITVLKVPAPKASFTANVTSGKAPLTVQFTDTSTNNPTIWLWSFGDGHISIKQNPVNRYEKVGKYTVTLLVTNYGGINTKIVKDYISVNK